MYSALYAYPWDVQDETPAAFCATAHEHIGVDRVNLAVSYHAGKILLPHNPRRRVYYPEDGALFFRPDLAAFHDSPIKPHVSTLAQASDVLADLCASADEAGMDVVAWTVTLHNTRLCMAYPEYTVRNAFGDPVITYLCPSHAAVRAYVCALASDLARRYPLRAIELEAAHYMPFVHGFHHEMQQTPVTPALQVLLGLCFCSACLDQARATGIDGEQVSQAVAGEIDRLLACEEDEIGEKVWEQPFWQSKPESDLQRYLSLRTAVIRELWREVRQAVNGVRSIPVHLQDPSTNLVQRTFFHSGLEMPPPAGIADGVTMLGYISDLPAFQAEVRRYSALVVPHLPLVVALRPVAPECLSAHDLAARVAFCREQGATGVAFYNYGMLPTSRFPWISQALAPLTMTR